MSRATVMVGALAILLGSQATAQTMSSAPVHLQFDASGARHIVIRSLAGTLEIAGRPALGRVEVHGERRGSSASALERSKVSLSRSGDTVFVEGNAREDLNGSGETASTNLVVTVPGAVPIVVTDCTHEITVHDTGPLEMYNGSGSTTIERIHGTVQVEGRSGRLAVINVQGDVSVTKSSGTTEIKVVEGDVALTARGSGRVTLSDVTGSVRLRGAKQSGSVAIDGVGGDLIIDTATTKRLSYSRVRGQVLRP